MILALSLLGCDLPATLYPTDPCRVGSVFDAVSAEVGCAAAGHTISATFDLDHVDRVGGSRSEAWDGLSYYASGPTVEGGSLAVGVLPETLGVYGQQGSTSAIAGFLPAGSELPDAPYVDMSDATDSCDGTGSGSVHLTGLPEDWADGGEWDMAFDAGSVDADPVGGEWTPTWPATCPISPRAWTSVRLSAACGGTVEAEIQFTAPASFQVELDALGQVATVSATWTDAFSARCDGGDLSALDGSLQGEDADLRLYTPVLELTREPDADWTVVSTACGECPEGWTAAVVGLPEI